MKNSIDKVMTRLEYDAGGPPVHRAFLEEVWAEVVYSGWKGYPWEWSAKSNEHGISVSGRLEVSQ